MTSVRDLKRESKEPKAELKQQQFESDLRDLDVVGKQEFKTRRTYVKRTYPMP